MTAWCFAIPNFAGPLAGRKQRKVEEKVLKLIKAQDGFVAVTPCWPDGTLLWFETENNAKGARNILRAEGVSCGTNIGHAALDLESGRVESWL